MAIYCYFYALDQYGIRRFGDWKISSEEDRERIIASHVEMQELKADLGV